MKAEHKIFTIGILGITSLPLIALGQEPFTPMVGIPGVDPSNANVEDYVNALYLLAISLAALIAVIKIIVAGVKYMFTDIINTKESAKKDIQGALFGLLIIMSAVLILQTINPELLRLNALERAEPVVVEGVRPPQADIYTGPETCTNGEILRIRTTDSGIERYCAPADGTDVSGDEIPDEGDATPGFTLVQEEITFPCAVAGACSFPTAPGYLIGIESARASCDIRSNNTGQFNVTGNGVGICTWETLEVTGPAPLAQNNPTELVSPSVGDDTITVDTDSDADVTSSTIDPLVQQNTREQFEALEDAEIQQAIDAGEFESVIKTYDIESVPLDERNNYRDNIWPTECEGERGETGFEFRTIGTRDLCVDPDGTGANAPSTPEPPPAIPNIAPEPLPEEIVNEDESEGFFGGIINFFTGN